MPSIRFTKSAIDGLPYAQGRQVIYRDTALRGLAVRVGARSKVFVVEGQLNKRTRRATIGRADVISVDEARKRAMKTLAEFSAGRDPRTADREREQEELTVAGAFANFFAARSSLASCTRGSYARSLNLYLSDWKPRKLTDLKRQMVLTRHRQIVEKHGGVTANNVMRHLRSVYNFNAAAYEEFPANPVGILTQARAWFPERRRRSLISASDLPDWWSALEDEPAHSRDFLRIALFTGMRRSEVSHLRWEMIDLKWKALHVPRTKNGDPLDLPLSDYLVQLLRERKLVVGTSPWVFPSSGKTGHVVETKSFTSRVSDRCGIEFTLHDLRRTFISIAESLDIPHYALKRLLNHRSVGDVTGGYIVIDTERLRDPVERVSQRILELAKAQPANMELYYDE